MPKGFRITDKDNGYKRLVRELGTKRTAIIVGVQGKEAGTKKQNGIDGPISNQTTVGDIAYFHEFGVGNPERSWLRGWIDENLAMIENDMSSAMRQVILGRLTSDQAGNILGTKWVASIQKRISDGIEPPNSNITVERKGSSTPLIDAGQLRSSITYTLEKMIQGSKNK